MSSALSRSFLVSPIAKDDASQQSFYEDKAEEDEALKSTASTAENEDPEEQALVVANGSPKIQALVESKNRSKRQRVEFAESVAISKMSQLSREQDALLIQLQQQRESHQSALHRKDLLVLKLKRQLELVVTEEQGAHEELSQLKHKIAERELQLRKKVVELDSQLKFVEDELSQWREKAVESELQIEQLTRQHKMQLEMLRQDQELAKLHRNSEEDADSESESEEEEEEEESDSESDAQSGETQDDESDQEGSDSTEDDDQDQENNVATKSSPRKTKKNTQPQESQPKRRKKSKKMSDVRVLQAQIRLLEAQLKQKDAQLQDATGRLDNAQEILETAQTTRALNDRIEELESSERKLKAELVGLIQSSKNLSVLEEKLYQANLKLSRSEEGNAKLDQKLKEMLVLEVVHKRFVDYFVQFTGDVVKKEELEQSPVPSVIKLFQHQQHKYEQLFEAKGSLENDLRQLQRRHELLTKQNAGTEQSKHQLESRLQELQQSLASSTAVQRGLAQTNAELLAVLKTYEKDAATTPTASAASAETPEPKSTPVAMESALKQTQEALEAAGKMREQATSAWQMAAKQEEEVVQLRKANEQLKKHLTQCEQDIALFEKRLGRGEFNPETTKVVHIAVNPAKEALLMRQIELLRHENDQLRRKMGLEASAGQAAAPATTPNTSQPSVTATSASSNSQSQSQSNLSSSCATYEGQKKLNERLKKVFREQTQRYREAVYLLTGYKVDLNKTADGVEMLRLRSMYAENSEDELLVRMEASGGLELLETALCKRIDARVFAYLTTCRSFPAFLSNLTLHLFEKQTFQG